MGSFFLRCFAPQSSLHAYLTALLLGIGFVALLLPLRFLGGHGAFFENGDASQHVTGWLFFAQDNWRFPLLRTERLNHPDGAVIAFTDSIPLAALFFKLILPLLPKGFQYIGLWQGIAFVLQAVGATFLIRSLGARHLLATLCAVVFGLSTPALLWRIGHTSLMTHGLILLTLGFYFKGRLGSWTANRAAVMLIAISAIALTVHPYFLAFCYALFLAFLADQGIVGEGWGKQLVRLVASVATIAIVGAVLGYFGNDTTTYGFGLYSMNVTAPFCGSRFYSCISDVTAQHFDKFHFIDATGGQYEGFNYLGAGALLLLPLAVIGNWRAIRTLPRRFPALLAVLVLCTLYALSNKVYVGTDLLVSYPLPSLMDRLTGTFRASGRFFWIVGYALLFSVLVGVLKRRAATTVALLVVAMALQWVDGQPLRDNIMRNASAPAVDDLGPLRPLMADIDKIDLFPAFGCGDSDVKIYWLFQRVAAYYGKLLDTGYIARPNVDCKKNEAAFADSFRERNLYLMPSSLLKLPFAIPAGFRVAMQRGECVTWQEVFMCKNGATLSSWTATGLRVTAPALMLKSDSAEWPGAGLPTRIGQPAGNRMVTADRSKAGFLTYGPYATLPVGRYCYAIMYASGSSATDQVGSWDVFHAKEGGGAQVVASGTLAGTGGNVQRIEGPLEVAEGESHLPFEIRTVYKGIGDLQIVGVAFQKLP